ncbi:MAG: tRNA uridine-5-carboxymethylaminomethyl(34) synthesis enzyme MnmG, partial [Buchnera aphidicola]|nr:tRNA uridine-5-carboxymethylaminomethyl(34) synthesis enzyme MnmG [Buchnera aphidicola]
PASYEANILNQYFGINIHKEITVRELLKRPEITYKKLEFHQILKFVISDHEAIEQVENEIKYEGYIKRQYQEIERHDRHESTFLSPFYDYRNVKGLSHEVVTKLNYYKPVSIGQASRISGVTPAAISILLVHLKKMSYKNII